MAAPTIDQIVTGLETRLATISGLRHTPYLPDQVNPPQAVVYLPRITAYHGTMQRGTMELTAEIHVYVSDVLSRTTRKALGTYMDVTGANSVIIAIEGDKTLGGVVSDLYVDDASELSPNEIAAIGLYGARFTVQIVAQGS